jgi:hypothetical protein
MIAFWTGFRLWRLPVAQNIGIFWATGFCVGGQDEMMTYGSTFQDLTHDLVIFVEMVSFR